jgi:hypothetical protein
MSWNNSDELHVGITGQIYVAPLGTALPSDPTAALNAAFVGLGYTTEDGFSFSASRETTDIGGWQTFDPLRTIITARTVQVSFALKQWNEETVPFAFGGGSISGSGPYTYNLPDPEDGLDERAMVIDSVDGDNHVRFVFRRGIVIEAVESQFQHGASADLPITFKLLKPSTGAIASILFDGDGFAAGS